MKLPDFKVDLSTLFSVEGKTALVTGGSSGIGKMIAEGFVRAGARVLICGRTAAAIEQAAAGLGAFGRCEHVVADVSVESSIRSLHREIADRFGSLDILVNSAGTTANAPIAEHTREEFARVVDVNLISVFDLTRELLPLLKAATAERPPARVVNVSSIAASRIRRGSTAFAYNASKAGVEMLTRHLAQALAPERITVNAIAPGLFPSRMSAPLFAEEGARQPGNRPTGDFTIPLGRAGSPEDVIAAALYLCSRGGAYLTGVTISPTGGFGTTV